MNQKLIVWAKGLSQKNVQLRKLLRGAGNLLGWAEYKWNTHGCKVDPKTVIFSAFYGQNYCCTPKAVYRYMQSQERFRDYQYIWVAKDPAQFQELEDMPNTRVVKASSKEYQRAMAAAGYWIFNHRMADYIRPGRRQTYVQCWHGTPLKCLGYDITASQNAMNSISEIRDKYRVDAARFHYLLSPSPFATEKFVSAWNLQKTGQTDKILEVGYPRNDFLVNFKSGEAERIRESLRIPKDKKVLLYAPTWRDDQHNAKLGYVYQADVDFEYLREQLGEEWVILFRAHYIVAHNFDFGRYEGFVYNVSDYNDINELYVIADALATDYSSVFFDYANLKRPIIFYMYDMEFYANELRGFYIDPAELPGPIVRTEAEFAQKLFTVDEWFAVDEKYQAFHEKFNPKDDGMAAKRLVDAVFL